jgi:hypothetical protein
MFDTKSKKIRRIPCHDREVTIKEIMSVYYYFYVDSNIDNDYTSQDSSGLNILDLLCQRLFVNPRHTYHIKGVLSNLPIVTQLIKDEKISLFDSILILFTDDELNDYVRSQ